MIIITTWKRSLPKLFDLRSSAFATAASIDWLYKLWEGNGNLLATTSTSLQKIYHSFTLWHWHWHHSVPALFASYHIFCGNETTEWWWWWCFMLVRLLAPSLSISISIHPSIHIVLCALITSLIRPMHVPEWRKQDGGMAGAGALLFPSVPFHSVPFLFLEPDDDKLSWTELGSPDLFFLLLLILDQWSMDGSIISTNPEVLPKVSNGSE